jgi:hypothetical protein
MPRWPIVIPVGLLTCLAAGARTGATVSTAYWGYVIGQPAMFADVEAATSVRRFSLIGVWDETPPESTTSPPADKDEDAKACGFYLDDSRAPQLLQRRRPYVIAAPADPTA